MHRKNYRLDDAVQTVTTSECARKLAGMERDWKQSGARWNTALLILGLFLLPFAAHYLHWYDMTFAWVPPFWRGVLVGLVVGVLLVIGLLVGLVCIGTSHVKEHPPL